MRNVLLTNDDGIEATGLLALATALAGRCDIRLLVVAPDRDRSGSARSVSADGTLRVWPVDLGLTAECFATSGTPVDAVRLARTGILDDFRPDVVVSGINHGLNLGDDIVYSGTVAAALEAALVGIPAVAVSQQSHGLEVEFSHAGEFTFHPAAAFVAELLTRPAPLQAGGILSINMPAREPSAVEVTCLVRRRYREVLRPSGSGDAHVYTIESTLDDRCAQAGTDAAAVAAGRISVTPLRLALMDSGAVADVRDAGLDAVLERAVTGGPA